MASEHKHRHHRHHHRKYETIIKVLKWAIIVNLIYVVVEACLGVYAHSLALIANAAYGLSNAFALALARVGIKLARESSRHKLLTSYQNSTIRITLLNTLILLVGAGLLINESIIKWGVHYSVNGVLVCSIAAGGVIISGLSALLIIREKRASLNLHETFIFLITNTIVSFGVVIAGLIIILTGFVKIDAIVALIIAAIIIISTYIILKGNLNVALNQVPNNINVFQIKSYIENLAHVKTVHHIHVWALNATMTAMTAHVKLDNREYEDEVLAHIKKRALEAGINFTTIEFAHKSSGHSETSEG